MAEAVAVAAHKPQIRPAVEGDRAFIGATWKQSYWRESPWGNRIRWSVFAPRHGEIIRRLLEHSLIVVACDPGRADEIAGYLVYEPIPAAMQKAFEGDCPAIHFAYVKPAFRRAGIFTALLAATGLPQDLAGVAITHGTRAWFSAPDFVNKGAVLKKGRAGLEEKFPGAIYDPYRWIGLP